MLPRPIPRPLPLAATEEREHQGLHEFDITAQLKKKNDTKTDKTKNN